MPFTISDKMKNLKVFNVSDSTVLGTSSQVVFDKKSIRFLYWIVNENETNKPIYLKYSDVLRANKNVLMCLYTNPDAETAHSAIDANNEICLLGEKVFSSDNQYIGNVSSVTLDSNTGSFLFFYFFSETFNCVYKCKHIKPILADNRVIIDCSLEDLNSENSIVQIVKASPQNTTEKSEVNNNNEPKLAEPGKAKEQKPDDNITPIDVSTSVSVQSMPVANVQPDSNVVSVPLSSAENANVVTEPTVSDTPEVILASNDDNKPSYAVEETHNLDIENEQIPLVVVKNDAPDELGENLQQNIIRNTQDNISVEPLKAIQEVPVLSEESADGKNEAIGVAKISVQSEALNTVSDSSQFDLILDQKNDEATTPEQMQVDAQSFYDKNFDNLKSDTEQIKNTKENDLASDGRSAHKRINKFTRSFLIKIAAMLVFSALSVLTTFYFH